MIRISKHDFRSLNGLGEVPGHIVFRGHTFTKSRFGSIFYHVRLQKDGFTFFDVSKELIVNALSWILPFKHSNIVFGILKKVFL